MSEHNGMTTHDLRVNGINIHYVTWGEFTRPERAVLLVHGLSANSQSWAHFGPRLAEQGWYAIAPDLRGRGLSEKPPHGYGLPFHANDLLSLCDELGLSAVHVMGHSLGAFIGLFFAAIYPARVGKLVLIDGGGKPSEDALPALASSLGRLGQVYPSLDAYLAALRQAATHPWTPYWENYYRYDALVHPDGTVTSRSAKAVIDEENAVNFMTRVEMLPAAVRAPTLIARATVGTLGPDRGFILPVEEAERLRNTISGSRLANIPDTNHYTITLSEVFTRVTLAFLAE